MEEKEIEGLINKQKAFFATGKTLSIKYRIEKLKKLYDFICVNEKEIAAALKEDLGKSEYESYMCEIGLVKEEATYMIKHIKKFSKDKKVHTPLSQFSSKSYQKSCPYGNVLIMSPWNYPFLLTMSPLVDALASGNTALIKPSAYSPSTSKMIEKICLACFEEEYVAIVKGGRKENAALLEKKFDFIFFTGSQAVGKEVLRKAAEHLTPAVLELGGKSPCIVDDSSSISLAAKRIVFGKFLNCGQTCVAPDYILCQRSIKDKLLKELVKQTKLQYGEKPLENLDYGRIVNEKHFSRLLGLIDKEKVVLGGENSLPSLKISPTIMDGVTFDDKVMQEEIFGPILPILTYENFDEIFSILKDREKPLALYIFSNNKKHIEQVTSRISFGGGCVNDCIIHLATTEMGFGGVGESGMGQYHGKVGFDTFSHKKSIVNKKNWIDLPMRYSPYKNKLYNKIIHFFLK